MRNISVAAVQFEHAPGDKEANLSKVRGFVKEAARQGVEIICLPECCLSGYWHLRHLSRSQLEALAEPVFGGPCCQEISSLSTEYNMTIGAGLIELADEGSLYNTYLIAMPNGDCQRHRKIHAFISKYVSSGSEFTVFETPHECRVGVLTCYDNNIGENVRITALKGAEILLAPHQTGGCGSINPHTMGKVDRALWDNRERNPEAIEAELRGPKGREWLMRWLPTRAHDNGLFLVFSNGVGIDDDEIRTGNAMIIDPYGRILAETWKAGDDMVIANLDASLLQESTGKRWIKTRRPELYNLLTVRTGCEED
ncbi:nitrilase family protein, partial [Acidobacteria bacterium AH-259-G07]|nr:nitrilase family protein [Acidobacteria bacterium AH-259-G07]